MSTSIDIRELPSRVADIRGMSPADEIVVTDGDKPLARLVPLPPVSGQRVPGLHPGAMEMSPDFNDPLPDESSLRNSSVA